MTYLTVVPTFNKNNHLEILIKNNFKKKINVFKVCFSLIYSIKSIKGAKIHKQVGRYYELILENPIISNSNYSFITLEMQQTKIGNYNMSCGPEGLFILNKNHKPIKILLKKLKFKKIIRSPYYKNIKKNVKIPIIPQPNIFKINTKFLMLANKFIITDKYIIDALKVFNPILKTLKINFKSKKGIKIIFKKSKLKKEEYIINIFQEKIYITTSDYAGKIYALISLVQLINFYKNKLPIGTIQDRPRFIWRGMHLDCARQFYSVIEIKRLLTYMALLKLNRFHWHLTDNEAWRLDIKSFPEIIKKVSHRGYSELIPPVYGSGFKKYGGYYSLNDVKEIIKFAKKLNIEVMPEIDLPAHSLALIKAMPEMIDRNFNDSFKDIGNYENNTINPSKKFTWKFLKIIFHEISNKFPFQYIHIGGDEIPVDAWGKSNKINILMNKKNFLNFDEVKYYFIKRVMNILKNSKKRIGIWNDAILSKKNKSINIMNKISNNCLIFLWQHPLSINKILKKGHRIIICSGQTCYFDMAYNRSTKERGLFWASTIETKKIHNWEPLEGIPKKYHSLVRGIQGQLWSETITNKKYLDIMINPRLAVLSEIAWSSDKRRKWSSFKPALTQLMKITKKLGWENHKF